MTKLEQLKQMYETNYNIINEMNAIINQLEPDETSEFSQWVYEFCKAKQSEQK